MAKIITEKELKELIKELAQKSRVIAPTLKHPHSAFSQFAFSEIETDSEIELCSKATILPAKEFLLEPRETLFSFEGQVATREKVPQTILFGLSVEDLKSVSLLTKIFSEKYNDEPFLKKRESLLLVGIDEVSPPKDIFFDLYLMRIGQHEYAAFPKTEKGKKITESHFFKNQNKKITRVEKKADPVLCDPDLAKLLEKSKNHPVWDELSEICFGCGICSYVCPLCYCFDVEDEIEIGSDKGKRVRKWDSCLLANFAATTNHNFRPELKERIFNWYYHKFVRMPKEIGEIGCVDCNRCIIYCPAKINFHNVLKRILADGKKRGQR